MADTTTADELVLELVAVAGKGSGTGLPALVKLSPATTKVKLIFGRKDILKATQVGFEMVSRASVFGTDGRFIVIETNVLDFIVVLTAISVVDVVSVSCALEESAVDKSVVCEVTHSIRV